MTKPDLLLLDLLLIFHYSLYPGIKLSILFQIVKMCICVKAYWAFAFLLLTQKTSNTSETSSLERKPVFS